MLIGMRVIAHELVTLKDVEGDPYDMLKVKLRGLEDSKTVCTILMAPSMAADYPLGDDGELTFEIRQQSLKLESEVH